MHAFIVAVNDVTYEKLIGLCAVSRVDDHSWLATHLLEQAVREAPVPGTCHICRQPFAQAPHKGAQRIYCSETCRRRGYNARSARYERRRAEARRRARKGA